jgi:hypothetical protein
MARVTKEASGKIFLARSITAVPIFFISFVHPASLNCKEHEQRFKIFFSNSKYRHHQFPAPPVTSTTSYQHHQLPAPPVTSTTTSSQHHQLPAPPVTPSFFPLSHSSRRTFLKNIV